MNGGVTHLNQSTTGTLDFFQVSSSRGADRRLAVAGLGAVRIAVSRIAASLRLRHG
jgi:hypothetical protein